MLNFALLFLLLGQLTLLTDSQPVAFRSAPADDCPLYNVRITHHTVCDDKGTVDWKDDGFRVDVKVYYRQRPDDGFLLLEGEELDTVMRVPVSALPAGDTLWKVVGVPMRATEKKKPIALTVRFTALPDCAYTNPRAGTTRQQCSVCVGPGTGQPYPSCWPRQEEDDPCSQSVNYAPDPDYPELTPIRYFKTVVHIFVKEDPEQLGQYTRHPTDPGNFTEEHIGIIRSWFQDSLGANWLLANLCDDPTDGSPHIKDARIRLLNTGTVGEDVFFHADNRGWGIGYSGCGGTYGYWYQTDERYITSPEPSNPYYEQLKRPETQNAFHVFITGGSWKAQPPGDPRVPDENDCYSRCAGGMTSSMSCRAGRTPQHPAQAIFGTYNVWMTNQLPGEQECESDYPGSDAGLGDAMLGEIFHVLSVDHLSPFQAHKKHPDGGDGCADTPLASEYNRLGCSYGTRCALSECQVGRMHHFFSELRPAFERFPDGQGGFTTQRPDCQPVEPPLLIPEGVSIVWTGRRELRSGVRVMPKAWPTGATWP